MTDEPRSPEDFCTHCVNEYALLEGSQRTPFALCLECGKYKPLQYHLGTLAQSNQKNEATLEYLQAHAAQVRVL